METVSKEQLIRDIKKLGIKHGDVIFVRISYKNIGKVEEGPKTVIDSMLDVIGEEGTLITTGFYKRYPSWTRFFHKSKIYDSLNPPKPVTGVIPIFAEKHLKAKLSGQPIYPFVIIGKHAESFALFHHVDKNPYDLLQEIAENYDAKCLRIGGDILMGTAHIAFSEALKITNKFQRKFSEGYYAISENNEKKWYVSSSSVFCYKGYESFFYEYVKPNYHKSMGKIGHGDATLTSMKETLDIERKYIEGHPEKMICNSPDCLICNYSFSFSKHPHEFVWRQIKNIFSNNKRKLALSNLYRMFKIVFWGVKCQ